MLDDKSCELLKEAALYELLCCEYWKQIIFVPDLLIILKYFKPLMFSRNFYCYIGQLREGTDKYMKLFLPVCPFSLSVALACTFCLCGYEYSENYAL